MGYGPGLFLSPQTVRKTARKRSQDSEQGEFDYLFVATSSTGTAQGCHRFIQDHHCQTKITAVDAVESVLFGGIPGPRHIPGSEAGREPALARHQSFDGVFRVSDVKCVVGCRRAVMRKALLVGMCRFLHAAGGSSDNRPDVCWLSESVLPDVAAPAGSRQWSACLPPVTATDPGMYRC